MGLENKAAVSAKLRNLKTKYVGTASGEEPVVVVGYTAKYAVYVHENIEMKWKGLNKERKPHPPHSGVYWGPNGQAKFLEQPARELNNTGVLSKTVADILKTDGTLLQGLYIAGLKIQAASQELVPVDFGFLRASAFTKKETE